MNAGWDALGELWDKATGGAKVAAEPTSGNSDGWPTAPRPAGMQEASNWFVESLERRSVPALLFFVGGPGAGKSHAAAEIVEQFLPVDQVWDGLAHRTYRYSAGASQVLLVNDATISEDSSGRNPLADDITETLAASSHMIACVNRGVLVEEVSSIRRRKPLEMSASQYLISWLHKKTDVDLKQGRFQLRNTVSKDYISSGNLFDGETQLATVCVVFADVCSLLEKSPSVHISAGGTDGLQLRASPYEIKLFTERQDVPVTSLPAGALLSQICERLTSSFAGQDIGRDPVTANILSLKKETVQAGLLNILRAAEIVAGQRFSYRELWGVYVRAIVADLPEQINRSLIKERANTTPQAGSDELVDFAGWQKSADLRFGQSIFGTGAPGGPDADRNPVTRLTWQVDPVRDALPGLYDPHELGGWCDVITESFMGHSLDSSPLGTLRRQLGNEDDFEEIITPFDEALDEAYCKAQQQKTTPQLRRKYASWYGTYLTRLYAIAHGIPAFRNEVSLWTAVWNLPGELPSEVEPGIRALLTPLRKPGEPGSKSLIPIFDSRTNPIQGASPAAKLAISTSDLDFSTRIDGETIFLILEEKSRAISEMTFDFSMIREAMAATDQHPGVTERTSSSAPRLERFRAARLIPDQLRGSTQFVAVKDDAEFQFVVSAEAQNG